MDVPSQILFWVFIAGLAWSPFWFGSNILSAWGANPVIFPSLALAYEILLVATRKRHPVGLKAIAMPAVLFAAVVIWILLQLATWTPNSLHHPIWQMSSESLGRVVDGSISVNRDLTALALLRLITAASVFWIALQLARDAARANLLLWSFAVISCAYAIYGLFAFAVMPGRILWFENPYTRGFVTSTFLNPNSFAAYAGMGFVAICGLILKVYRREFGDVGGSIRFRIARFIELTGRKGAALLAGALVVFVSLLLSGSRAGIASTALALVLMGALTLGQRKSGFAEQREAIIISGAVLVALTFVAFGDTVVGKIARQGFADESRFAVYMITLRSIFGAPLLGYGYGTFADVFPMFRDQSVGSWGQWQMAHNTYLEVFQGLGILFATMLIGCVVLLCWRCAKGALTRQMNQTLPCVAASIAFLLGLHALLDFSLQIQANAITFMAILGAGVAQSESSRLALHD
jgi:hypothetical protein